jgi:hypothetical protein
MVTQGALDRQGDDGRERNVYYLALWRVYNQLSNSGIIRRPNA